MKTVKPIVIYFADVPFEGSVEGEWKSFYARKLKDAGIIFKVKCIDIPPEGNFDILFFDWGGMSLGNSMLEHFCFNFIKDAEDNPNRLYVMASQFTLEAAKDCLLELGNKEKPANLLLGIEEFIKHYKIMRS